MCVPPEELLHGASCAPPVLLASIQMDLVVAARTVLRASSLLDQAMSVTVLAQQGSMHQTLA